MFGPPARFCRILISLLIFFFFTGFSTLMMHFSGIFGPPSPAPGADTSIDPFDDPAAAAAAAPFPILLMFACGATSPTFTPSNTSEYFPRPTFRRIS